MAKYQFDEIAINCKEKMKPENIDISTYVGLEHLDSGSLTVTRWGSDVPIKGDKLAMHKGDVLLGKRNAYLRRAAIAPHDGAFSAHGMVLRPREEVIDKDFFPLFIASDYFFDEAVRISVGSLSPTVNWKDLRAVEFELPSKDEQRALAKALWAMNRTKEAYKTLLSRTDELVKSQFLGLFGDPDLNPMGWEKKTLGECLRAIESGKSLNCEDHPRTDNQPAVLKLSAVTYGVYNASENKLLPDEALFVPTMEVHEGDLLFSRKNTYEYVGMTAYVDSTPPNLMLPDLIFRLVPKDCIRPTYLGALINHPVMRPHIRELAGGTSSSMPNISKQRLSGLVIPVPDMTLQIRYEALAKQSDKSKFELEQSIAELDATYKKIISDHLG